MVPALILTSGLFGSHENDRKLFCNHNYSYGRTMWRHTITSPGTIHHFHDLQPIWQGFRRLFSPALIFTSGHPRISREPGSGRARCRPGTSFTCFPLQLPSGVGFPALIYSRRLFISGAYSYFDPRSILMAGRRAGFPALILFRRLSFSSAYFNERPVTPPPGV